MVISLVSIQKLESGFASSNGCGSIGAVILAKGELLEETRAYCIVTVAGR